MFHSMFRLLAFAWLGLACWACQQNTPSQESAPARPLPAVPAAKPLAAALPLRDSQPELSGAGADSLNPRPVDVVLVGAAQLRAAAADSYTEVDTLSARFVWLQAVAEAPRLLYRANPLDTTWLELRINFDRHERGNEAVRLTIEEANLDGRGRPEVLVRLESAANGSGGGTTWSSVYLLDVTPPQPLLLVQAQVSCIYEAFAGYAQLHGLEVDPDEQFTGCDRAVQLHKRELRFGPIEPTGNFDLQDSELTRLPAGRYRYQHGKVFRVGE
jgi:hypothetical protein